MTRPGLFRKTPPLLVAASALALGMTSAIVPEPCSTSDPWPEIEQVCTWQLDYVPSECSFTEGYTADWTRKSGETLYHCRHSATGMLKCATREKVPCQALVRRIYNGPVHPESTCDLDTSWCLGREGTDSICVSMGRDIVIYQAYISDSICSKPSRLTPLSDAETHMTQAEAIR